MAAMLTLDDVRFTQRQREVVRLIAEGNSNAEIAERLGISPRTAKAHSDTLRTKLGVARRRQIPAAYRGVTGEDPHELPVLGHGTGDADTAPPA
jgi:DNA-binding CsgD family transcriptional regulator